MKKIKIGLLSIPFLVFLTSCFSAETTDSPAENQAIYSQTMPDSYKSDSIQHLISKVVNDGDAPGMVAAIISGEGVICAYTCCKAFLHFFFRPQFHLPIILIISTT